MCTRYTHTENDILSNSLFHYRPAAIFVDPNFSYLSLSDAIRLPGKCFLYFSSYRIPVYRDRVKKPHVRFR